jgi:acetoin utilization protein AcuB
MDWQEVHASYGEREGVVLKIVEWMSKPLLAVKPLDRITRARKLMIEKRVNQLAVVHDGRLVGIVTDRDLRDAFPSAFDVALADSRRQQSLDPEKVSVENVMSADVVTLGADASLADAAELMRERRIGALPVIDAGKPVGIVTRSDILRAFVALAGKTG